LGVAALGRSVDRDTGIDGDDEDALATQLLGDRRADSDGSSGDDGDADDSSPASTSSHPSKSPAALHSARMSRNPKKSP
jgi:hypothetical protein